MFGINTDERFQDILPGIKIKTLVHGDKTLMAKFLLGKGGVLPKHAHPFEQTGCLIQGKLNLTIGNISREIKAGDCWCIGPDVAHFAEALEDSIALEIFSPSRPDYLKYFCKEDGIPNPE